MAEGNRRLSQLRSQTHGILVGHDLMAAKNDPLAQFFPHPGERLAMFAAWFETTAKRSLLSGNWWERFLQRAYNSGVVAGSELVGTPPSRSTRVPTVYRELAAQEFAGIAAAMIQQVTRQAAMASLGGLKPGPMYRTVLMAQRKIGQARFKAAVNTMAVQLHNAGRLAQFRASGVRYVGIDPELLEAPRPSRFLKHDHAHDHWVRDDSAQEKAIQKAQDRVDNAQDAVDEALAATAEAELAAARAHAKLEVAQAKVETAENEVTQSENELEVAQANLGAAQGGDSEDPRYAARVSLAETQVSRAQANLDNANAQADAAHLAVDDAQSAADNADDEFETAKQELEDARAELEAAQAALEDAKKGLGEFVNVLTAGDDKVCQICQDLATDGPYSLEEARPLLPAHPHCRCTFIPMDEQDESLKE
jgi:exonuclease VII small subunit